MNDVDQEVRGRLHELIDPEPVGTQRAFDTVVGKSQRRSRVPIRVGAFAAAAIAAAVLVAVLAPTKAPQSPPYRLVGAEGAEVVVHVDGTDPDAPSAELTVGDTTVQGMELPPASSPGPDDQLPAFELPASSMDGLGLFERQPVDVPDGSSLLVEGNFDAASAGAVHWVVMWSSREGDSKAVVQLGTWQLDSSGGSVVFEGPGSGDILVVDATIGSVDHYFLFTVRVAPTGGS
jgi:hypothetical protein